MPTIIGLTGRKGHGKDSFAQIVMQYNSSFKRLAFADHLKTICCLVYGIDRKTFMDPFEKERPFHAPLDIDKTIDKLRDVSKLPNIEKHGMQANSPRQLLQYVGTEYVRGAKDTYWLDKVSEIIEADKEHDFIITDLRFANEAERIRQHGGTILKILRLSKVETHVLHASEELAFTPDFTLAVMEKNWMLPRLVAASIDKDLRFALEYFDWDHLRSFASNMGPWDTNGLRRTGDAMKIIMAYYGEALFPMPGPVREPAW